MSKFKFYFLLSLSVVLFSCNKSDDSSTVVLRDFQDQFDEDIALMQKYLQTHYIQNIQNTSGYDDQDITIAAIPEGGTQTSIWDLQTSTTYPKLFSKEVELDEITYTIYYLKLREDYAAGVAPTRVDKATVSYRGSYLYYSSGTIADSKQFENNPYPDDPFVLNSVIRGWTEIIPLFKAGTKTIIEGEPTLYNNFGAGVMFIPSGLAYYNQTRGVSGQPGFIPSYSPLMFTFKLYDVVRMDQDGDGILSMYEDINGDGVFDDDTDDDGIYDYNDTDDDGDGYLTRFEIKNPATGEPYPYDLIPTCSSGKKNYLDKTCP
ncbi:FKBP-type peptidylprolyl isomerase [Flavobacterium sp. CYK-55]|uniref:FKBP-type peptidyl-prolyl cis-trans isomerase n=1 Tax=Flavobacterium sp. CYK-55 TaxID=2835529 RepID=UPI001BD0C31A|nr:FKBP-type peptidylprolyl isomerase [Flavobacterium sp. CYK-55]MBS7787409.1 FKBP-type peptidylprolyl isomerase [Flavobacterium sp. CYK-55]